MYWAEELLQTENAITNKGTEGVSAEENSREKGD